MCGLCFNEARQYNDVLTLLVIVANKIDDLQPDGLQLTPVEYQKRFGFLGLSLGYR